MFQSGMEQQCYLELQQHPITASVQPLKPQAERYKGLSQATAVAGHRPVPMPGQ